MPECEDTSDDTGMWCCRHHELILDTCCDRVTDVLGVARSVYLGRTHHPERRLLEHLTKDGRDHLLVVHWGAAWDEISTLEERIIERYDHLARLRNVSSTSDGRLNSPWNALYASFALKRGVKSLPGAMVVRRLHWRHRLWPDAAVPCRPVLLRAGTDAEGAADLLSTWAPRRRQGARQTRPKGTGMRSPRSRTR